MVGSQEGVEGLREKVERALRRVRTAHLTSKDRKVQYQQTHTHTHIQVKSAMGSGGGLGCSVGVGVAKG